MAEKTKRSKLSKIRSLMRKRGRSFIIRIPEERDDAPHWLFWVLIILLVIFLVSWVWLNWSGSSALFSYLSYR